MALNKLAAAVPPVGLVEGKKADNGAPVAFQGAVTVSFGDYFYVENSNRSNGIRIDKVGSGVSAGHLSTSQAPWLPLLRVSATLTPPS